MHYTRLRVVCDPDFTEILIAEVAEAGFDMFMENENGFEAHGEETGVDQNLLDEIKKKYEHVNPLIFYQDKIQKENWNEEWEKNVEPIIVEDQCLVRAAFHNIEKKYPYEIVITPKMSFGTGHHPTTYLMLKHQLILNHMGKRVMDAGCGTAILSVMACKRSAAFVDAFDIDEWSIENGKENAQLNGCPAIRIRRGTIRDFQWNEPFDIVLANINKNILLAEIDAYAASLRPGGHLLLSGFYEKDIPELTEAAGKLGLQRTSSSTRESWAVLELVRMK